MLFAQAQYQFQLQPAQRAAGRAPLLPPGLGPPWRRRPAATATVRRPLRRHPLRWPLLHPPGRATRRDRRRQPPEGLHYCGRRARQPTPPQPTAGQAPRQFRRGRVPKRRKRIRRGQTGDFPTSVGRHSVSNGAAAKRSQNRFPTQRGGFCTPGTGGAINVSKAAESAAPADTAAKSAAVSATPAYTASEDGSLTSSPPSRGQSSGGALWRPVSCCCIAVQQHHDFCYVQCTVPAIKAALCIEIN